MNPNDPTQLKLLASLAVIAGLWTLRALFQRLLNRYLEDVSSRLAWRQIINFVATGLTIILLIRVWFDWFNSVITMLSVIAAAITIVSKEILLNVFSYAIIVWRGLFTIGDRIQIGTTSGDVIQLGAMYISVVETSQLTGGDRANGRVVKIPNKEVIDKHVINFSRGHNLVWHEMDINLVLSANWQKAVDLLMGILEKESYKLEDRDLEQARNRNEEMIFIDTKPTVYLKVTGDKYVLTARYLCKCYQVRETMDRIWKLILESFSKEADLHFPEKEKQPETA